MEAFKRKLQFGFVLIMSVLFIQCSSDDDNYDGDKRDEFRLQAPHTYDIKFTKGAETIRYSGSINDDDDNQLGFALGIDDNIEALEGYKTISLLLNKDGVTITGSFVLDKNGNPYSLTRNNDFEKRMEVSSVRIMDLKKNITGVSKSGKVTLKNLKSHKFGHITDGYFVSYTLDIDGEFEFTGKGYDEPTLYSVSGKVVMSPYIK